MFATVVPVHVDRDRPVYTAARVRAPLELGDRRAHRWSVHVRRLDDDRRGIAAPGNACCIRLYACTTGSDVGSVSGPFMPSRSCSAVPRARPAGRRQGPRRGRAGRGRGRRSRPRSGFRHRCGGAGRQTGHAATVDIVAEPGEQGRQGVSRPSTAIATTTIVARANDENVGSPVRNIPAIAAITVSPEISTERPDVAAAASSAARSLRPAARSCRSRFK